MNKRKSLKFKLILLISLIHVQGNCAILIFDVDGVILDVSKFKAFKKLGLEILGHTDLPDRFFEFLNFIDNDKSTILAKFRKYRMPSYLCKWHKDELTSKELLKFINKSIEQNPDFFKSNTEKKLVKKTATFFLPYNNMKVTKSVKEMVRIIKECKNKKDQNGELVNQLFIATNCNEDTFAEIKRVFPECIDLFDKNKIIVSGKIKMIKPYKNFYCYMIDKYKLNPKKCFLIDDQEENITGAQKCGMKGILHKNIATTRQELKRIGAL